MIKGYMIIKYPKVPINVIIQKTDANIIVIRVVSSSSVFKDTPSNKRLVCCQYSKKYQQQYTSMPISIYNKTEKI